MPKQSTPSAPHSRTANNDHHAPDGGFRNPRLPPAGAGLLTFLGMRLRRGRDWPNHARQRERIPTVRLDPGRLHDPGGEPRLTWIGHSTFLIQYRGLNILTDPVFCERVSPLRFAGPRRLVPLPIRIPQLPPIDYVVVSHNHYDHLDLDSIRLLGNRPRYLVPLGLAALLAKAGIDRDRTLELDWWHRAELDGLRATATPAQHWSGRGLRDRNRTLWCGWHLRLADFSLWFAGDTGYNDVQFRDIGDHLGPVDLALIPIGAFEPRWFMRRQHVNPEEAVRIHQEVGSRLSVGMHWGTFQLSAEDIDAPREQLGRALAHQSEARPFITMAIGENRRIPLTDPADGPDAGENRQASAGPRQADQAKTSRKSASISAKALRAERG